jgi:hypothetical protein
MEFTGIVEYILKLYIFLLNYILYLIQNTPYFMISLYNSNTMTMNSIDDLVDNGWIHQGNYSETGR